MHSTSSLGVSGALFLESCKITSAVRCVLLRLLALRKCTLWDWAKHEYAKGGGNNSDVHRTSTMSDEGTSPGKGHEQTPSFPAQADWGLVRNVEPQKLDPAIVAFQREFWDHD